MGTIGDHGKQMEKAQTKKKGVKEKALGSRSE
jgi:hypothetical protein